MAARARSRVAGRRSCDDDGPCGLLLLILMRYEDPCFSVFLLMKDVGFGFGGNFWFSVGVWFSRYFYGLQVESCF